MKGKHDEDVQNENNSINIKSHEVYVPSSILTEEIKSEVSLLLGILILPAPFLTIFLIASHSLHEEWCLLGCYAVWLL
jgi:hypothetical protein